MPFHAPSWVPALPMNPPDSIPISDFMFDENFGRYPLGYSKAPFTCGLTGKTYSALEVKERIDYLARGLAKEFGWHPNKGSEWDKVIAVFSVNTLDTLTLAWAAHRLGGLQSPANAAYSAAELEYQLKDSGAKCLFTCAPLLKTAQEAARKAGIRNDRIYILDLPAQFGDCKGLKSVNDLIQEGSRLARLEALNWQLGEGAKRTAFLCYSSGTSGLPKGVMISHRNVIANTMQITAFEKPYRERKKEPLSQVGYVENALGLLPMSHIYGLVVICHASVYRGDGVIVLPKFEFTTFLESIQRFQIHSLYLVPPIIIQMTKNASLLSNYDLSSVWSLFTGAAPLGKETADDIHRIFPSWSIRQGYGLTETCTVVCSTSPDDIWFGSSGSLLPGVECKIVTIEGNEVTGYDQPGELLVKSPSVVLGYLNRPEANKETFQDGYMRTGDEAVIRRAPSGNEHVFIVDRIKELIKVKGHQVAPAELEAHLLTHPAVNDCAVIPVPDDAAGEVPKAFVVKSPAVGLEESDRMVARQIQKHVEEHKARYKWIAGGVEFIDVIPKSPSGKILRRLLRDKEKESRRAKGAKLSTHLLLFPAMSAHNPHTEDREEDDDEDDAMLDPTEVGEELADDGDAPMDSGDDEDGDEYEIQLQNDSVAHFDSHKDSIFCIAQHPVHPELIATGGGDDIGYIFDASSGGPAPAQGEAREGLKAFYELSGHTDSINAVTFTLPKGQYVVSAGLDGKLRAHQGEPAGKRWKFLAEAQEVEEINWLIPCPHPEHPNVVALGANDGSVWVYQINAADKASPLTVLQAYYLHTESCTAGTWSPDGKLLATVSEDSSLYVWDVFGEAASSGVAGAQGGQAVVGQTGQDERFRVEGGLYSVGIPPNGAFVVVGGPEGQVRIIGLPKIGSATTGASKGKAAGKASASSSAGQTGQILAALQAGNDNVETIAFSEAPLTLMAIGNVDSSITLFDTAHRFAVRRRIEGAHADDQGEHAVIKVEFVKSSGWLLTSCGYDGVVRRWDARGGTAAAQKGLVGEWRGHRGGGEGGGILGFVQGGNGNAIVTAGDDSISLVFSTPI
ncbi:acetyl-CoA synthetase-like protein [Delitschia confertaspora ATCC 74209]|uniref:Acetyl-CoA synthetase-like protein n=1 Tax=Delitschia confertaspora ATCC 74209 TaxID=1513339 RepID=A0A9P4JM41_9PLEO|nr:acetyl-CoA synthetase-like protein [Delitschia confertaspora ATCC 74209]